MDFLLTAAHCIQNKGKPKPTRIEELSVLLGAHNLSNPHEDKRISRTLSKIEIHEDWDPNDTRYDADIAMLTVNGEIEFTQFIQKICLWKEPHEKVFNLGSVAGWGKSENARDLGLSTPKRVELSIKSYGDCSLSDPQLAYISSNRTFCAGLEELSSVCQGDSGSGLFVLHQNLYFLKGIVSSALLRNNFECDISRKSVFTDVFKFRLWISTKAGIEENSGGEDDLIPVGLPHDAYLYGLNRVDDTSCSKYSGFAPCFYQNIEERNRRCSADKNCTRGEKWSYHHMFQGLPFLKGGLCHCCKCN